MKLQSCCDQLLFNVAGMRLVLASVEVGVAGALQFVQRPFVCHKSEENEETCKIF